jgi:hypothetical protein
MASHKSYNTRLNLQFHAPSLQTPGLREKLSEKATPRIRTMVAMAQPVKARPSVFTLENNSLSPKQ